MKFSFENCSKNCWTNNWRYLESSLRSNFWRFKVIILGWNLWEMLQIPSTKFLEPDLVSSLRKLPDELLKVFYTKILQGIPRKSMDGKILKSISETRNPWKFFLGNIMNFRNIRSIFFSKNYLTNLGAVQSWIPGGLLDLWKCFFALGKITTENSSRNPSGIA